MFPFFRRAFTIHIEFPSLDRLLDFLERDEQEKIDLLTAQVQQATQTLKTSTAGLQQAVTSNNS